MAVSADLVRRANPGEKKRGLQKEKSCFLVREVAEGIPERERRDVLKGGDSIDNCERFWSCRRIEREGDWFSGGFN